MLTLEKPKILFVDFEKDMRLQIAEIGSIRKKYLCSQTGFMTYLFDRVMVGAKEKKFGYCKDRIKNLRSIMQEELPDDYREFDTKVKDMIEEQTVDSVKNFEETMDNMLSAEMHHQPLIRRPFEKNVRIIESLIEWYERNSQEFTHREKLAVVGCGQILSQYDGGVLRCPVVDALFTELNRQALALERMRLQMN